MANNTWAYCPDRQGTCGLLIANAERMERDAARIAELGEECHQLRLMTEQAAAAENANAADLRRARAEIRDLERENASLRRRLAVGGR